MSRFDDAVRQLAAEHLESKAPPEIESAVLAEFDRARRHKLGVRWTAGAAAVAASIAALWIMETRPVQKPRAAPVSEAATGAPVEKEADQPFVAIPYVLPPGPYERVEVVRMSMPVSALIAAGLPVRTSDQGAQAEADVLVGQDGRPRAVRLVSISVN